MKTKTSVALAVTFLIAIQSYCATYDWSFNTSANPSYAGGVGALVQPGQFSIGWTYQLPFSANTGFWDLGASGTIAASIPNGSSTATVETIEWYDGWIYGSFATISVSGGTLTGDSYSTFEPWPSFFGNWIKHTQTFTAPSSGWNMVITGAPWGSVIGNLKVTN